ncbi:pentapeptide repeat-containing protein [Actinosynnema sp. NPDC047251]|uniref:pentapeptide repeat-containing protein n=1 Tax=Saccharothrix espanaensis TaxID=103731 RepID=UPI00130E36B7|nr:pentapeptide repeat-containing protein [Saccharothrix espanaensis]
MIIRRAVAGRRTRRCPNCRRTRLRARTWAQLGGLVTSLVTVVALVFTSLSLHETRRQVDATMTAQLAERFTKAVDQTGHDKPHVRLGGIYALGTIARDSADHRPTVGRVLSAYVRRHRELGPDGCAADVGRGPVDVAAALDTALEVGASHAVNFARSCLDGVELPGAALRCANLTGASLRVADLRGADLGEARLAGARLDVDAADDPHPFGANLSRANLSHARLGGADLRHADLTGADLTGADLADARLTGADLTGARLAGAQLVGADLTGATLTGADLTGANVRKAGLDDRAAALRRGAVDQEHRSRPDTCPR